MKELILRSFLFLYLSFSFLSPVSAEPIQVKEDSEQLQLQDMLMIVLSDPIHEGIHNYYSKYLTEDPLVYPYQVEIQEIKRQGTFRTFHFLIKLEVTPVVGPHISVGKDRLTFEIAPTVENKVKLVGYEHVETHELPKHWQHIIRNPINNNDNETDSD